MGWYGYLVSPESRKYIWLGKAVMASDTFEEVSFFHIGSDDHPKNSEREDLTRAVWKFLAEHAGKEIKVVVEYDFDAEGLIEIGGDSDEQILFSEYLKDWPG